MNKKDTERLYIDGAVEEEKPVDERLQAVLHADLIDFFSFYQLINERLRYFLVMYQFKDFNDLKSYYEKYVVPQLKAEYENIKSSDE